MFSILNRIRACVFVRTMVVFSIVVFVCVAVAPNVTARAPDREVAVSGDGDGIGGFKESVSGETVTNTQGGAVAPDRDLSVVGDWTIFLGAAWFLWMHGVVRR